MKINLGGAVVRIFITYPEMLLVTQQWDNLRI